jgi:hypothetical protein
MEPANHREVPKLSQVALVARMWSTGFAGFTRRSCSTAQIPKTLLCKNCAGVLSVRIASRC